MTPEEKNALLQFTGRMYGESKKNDDMLVSGSAQLQPNSNRVKQQFEQVLKAPVYNGAPPPRQPQAQKAQPPAVQGPVSPEQAAQELAQAQAMPQVDPQPVQQAMPQQPDAQQVVQPVIDPNQMEFELTEPTKIDKVIELLEKQNKLLVEIRDSSIKSKYNAKRAKNKKPQ